MNLTTNSLTPPPISHSRGCDEAPATEQLPELTGSEKQVAWAMTLRYDALKNIESEVSASYSIQSLLKLSARGMAISAALNAKGINLTNEESHALIRSSMLAITKAVSWIDARNYEAKDSVRSRFAFNSYKETVLTALEELAGIEKAAPEQLPPLTGSDQDVAPATKLRDNAIANIEFPHSCRSSISSVLNSHPAIREAFNEKGLKLDAKECHRIIKDAMLTNTDAKTWIDCRNRGLTVKMTDRYNGAVLAALKTLAAA